MLSWHRLASFEFLNSTFSTDCFVFCNSSSCFESFWFENPISTVSSPHPNTVSGQYHFCKPCAKPFWVERVGVGTYTNWANEYTYLPSSVCKWESVPMCDWERWERWRVVNIMVSISGAVWPDLAKFRRFGTTLKTLVIFKGFIKYLAKFLNDLETFLCHWANFHCSKCQKLSK